MRAARAGAASAVVVPARGLQCRCGCFVFPAPFPGQRRLHTVVEHVEQPREVRAVRRLLLLERRTCRGFDLLQLRSLLRTQYLLPPVRLAAQRVL
jgi:hypothetical protein